MNESAPKTVRERIEDALREIGTLLIALAPLDGIFSSSQSPSVVAKILITGGTGVIVFVMAILLERSRL